MSESDYISSTVEPTFIKMGVSDLINLNTVQQIKLQKNEPQNDFISFIFTDGKRKNFDVENCETILELVKVPYTFSTK